MEKAVQVITEDQLLKSITELEAKAAETPVKEAPEPKVEEAVLTKSIDSIRENASAATRRALDVSDVLTDIVGLMAQHNDTALGSMQKSINAAADRDLAMVRVLTDLKKSVDSLKEEVKKYGEAPNVPRLPGKEEVLNKSLGEAPKVDPRVAKRQIAQGLEILTKSVKPDDPKCSEYASAAVKFETTGQISDTMLGLAQRALTGA
jgi:hypothetical protein